MGWIWRAIIAALLVGGPAFLLPVAVTSAASSVRDAVSEVRGPANADDPEDLCGSANPRKQKKCKYNGWDNDNWNGNDNDDAQVAAPDLASSVDGLRVTLWRSTETPVRNAPLMLAVRGEGAPIARVSWTATGPTAENIYGDDLAHLGELWYDCAGVQPCAWSWTVMPRHTGYYSVHARVQDTAGRQTEVVWQFTAQ
jgi:hypothetical protein